MLFHEFYNFLILISHIASGNISKQLCDLWIILMINQEIFYMIRITLLEMYMKFFTNLLLIVDSFSFSTCVKDTRVFFSLLIFLFST